MPSATYAFGYMALCLRLRFFGLHLRWAATSTVGSFAVLGALAKELSGAEPEPAEEELLSGSW